MTPPAAELLSLSGMAFVGLFAFWKTKLAPRLTRQREPTFA